MSEYIKQYKTIHVLSEFKCEINYKYCSKKKKKKEITNTMKNILTSEIFLFVHKS